MDYICLIYSDEKREAMRTPEEDAVVYDAYNAFTKAVRDAGALIHGEAFHPTSEAKTVQMKNGRPTVMAGPAVKTDLQLNGIYILRAPDIDKATEWAAQIPGAKAGRIEVRPLIDFSAG